MFHIYFIRLVERSRILLLDAECSLYCTVINVAVKRMFKNLLFISLPQFLKNSFREGKLELSDLMGK